ncbi:mannose-6-phosphate isomerase-like protein (cupin superfamily) [Xanthomonas sacchari]|uniref:cupin domain-containing protein n=1 Tax=unclassified Xanthomonas TaxID=2643310 RepID=UPI00184132EF|nr:MULTISPECIES: cupin domain-containing protein [unclassified Xanthomonas]MBB6366734.1 mannose-6-phosphate isomerase-like protein (cupin superfamily) [Xanthomonas sp. F10]
MPRRDFDPATFAADGRPATQARLFDPDTPPPWHGFVAGAALGGAVTVLTYGTEAIDDGPPLHVHPYDETFVVLVGRAAVLRRRRDARGGGWRGGLRPTGVPHRFENLGPGRLQTMDIHHAPTWIQTDLD